MLYEAVEAVIKRKAEKERADREYEEEKKKLEEEAKKLI